MNWDLEAGHVMTDHNVVHGKFCSLLIYIGSVRSNSQGCILQKNSPHANSGILPTS